MSVTAAHRLRLVIAEDAVLLREGLRRVLTDAGLEVAGVAGDAAQLLQCGSRNVVAPGHAGGRREHPVATDKIVAFTDRLAGKPHGLLIVVTVVL